MKSIAELFKHSLLVLNSTFTIKNPSVSEALEKSLSYGALYGNVYIHLYEPRNKVTG